MCLCVLEDERRRMKDGHIPKWREAKNIEFYKNSSLDQQTTVFKTQNTRLVHMSRFQNQIKYESIS